MRKGPILAIDFDNTIAYSPEYPKISGIVPDVDKALFSLKDMGCFFILWTCRTGKNLSHAIDWVEKNLFPFDAYNENLPKSIYSPMPKIYADFYIDDRNIGAERGTVKHYWDMVIKDVYFWIDQRKWMEEG